MVRKRTKANKKVNIERKSDYFRTFVGWIIKHTAVFLSCYICNNDVQLCIPYLWVIGFIRLC
jgi:hypothetical protein